MSLLGPYLAACLLLIGSGLAKLRRPSTTSQALATVLPRRIARPASSPLTVRALGLIETAAGSLALVHPTAATAAAVAVLYVCFGVFVLATLRRPGQRADCGCLGTPGTPVGPLHVIVNACFAASSALVAASGTSAFLPAILRHEPAAGVPLAGAAILLAILAGLSITLVARLQLARTAR
jgi:hypothetical protein